MSSAVSAGSGDHGSTGRMCSVAPAVEAVSVSLSYGTGKQTVQALNGANLSVPRGVIFSLLGPSGCGKSTLLAAILGLRRLQKGYVQVFGKRPGTRECGVPGPWVGFMPQDLILHPDLSVSETMSYYGNLQLVPKEVLTERVRCLMDLLGLASTTKRLVRLLSGGQQRRLSLAVSLVHDPVLVLLDEPTVGADPLLRNAIWGHLEELAKNRGRTIVITTHYIEEARRGNLVGLMRGGRIIETGNPEELMRNGGFTTLEEVFLKKCLEEDSDSCHGGDLDHAEDEVPCPIKSRTEGSCANPSDIIPSVDRRLSTRIRHSLAVVKTVAYKNVLLLWRNYWLLIIALVMPVGILTLSTSIIGLPPFDLPLTVVNRDSSVASAGSKYLQTLDNHTFKLSSGRDLEESVETVRAGTSAAVLLVGEGFTRGLLDRMTYGLQKNGTAVADSKLRLFVGGTNLEVERTIYFSLLSSFDLFVQSSLRALGYNTRLGTSPLQFEEPVYGSRKPTYSEFLTASLVPNGMLFASLGLSAMTFVAEQQFFQRSVVSGLSVSELLLAHVITQIVVLLVMSGSLVLVLFGFGLVSWNQAWLAVLIVLFQGTVGMSIGVFVSVVADCAHTALVLTTMFYNTFNYLNGVLWPVQGQPSWLQPFSYCLAETRNVDAMRSVISRGWGLGHRVIWTGLLASFIWTIATLTLALLIFRVKHR